MSCRKAEEPLGSDGVVVVAAAILSTNHQKEQLKDRKSVPHSKKSRFYNR